MIRGAALAQNLHDSGLPKAAELLIAVLHSNGEEGEDFRSGMCPIPTSSVKYYNLINISRRLDRRGSMGGSPQRCSKEDYFRRRIRSSAKLEW